MSDSNWPPSGPGCEVVPQMTTAVLAAAYHDLMLAECPTLLAGHVHDPQWTKFRLETNRARGAQAGCRIRLRTVDGAWTRARILHYQWDRQGRAYLDKLVAAIHAPRRRRDVKNRPLDLLLSWDDAVVKLNQLLLRRHRIWEITGRNGVIAADVNPIQPIDLDCLKEWVAGAPAGAAGSSSYTRPKDKTQLGPLRDTPLQPADLPQGFSFDRFGLLTRRFAVPEVHAGASESPQPPQAPPQADPQPPQAPLQQLHQQQQQQQQQRGRHKDAPSPAAATSPFSSTAPTRNGSRVSRTRSASYSDTEQAAAASKRPRLDTAQSAQPTPRSPALDLKALFSSDSDRDDAFRQRVLGDLTRAVEARQTEKAPRRKTKTYGDVNNSVVSALLRIAKRPNTDPLRGRIEAHVVSTDEARTMLEHTSPDAPIIAQTGLMAWDPNRGRPIEQLLDMVVTRDAKLSIQIPSQPITETGQSFRKIKFSDAAARFLANEPSDNPWNVLDFGNPHGECTTPTFLAHGGCRNTRLLRDIKMELTNEGSAGRTVTAPTVEKYWTEVISWVLLSEGGNVTGPHTDAYGQATHISVQEGEVGFGWMSHPTDDVLGRWTESDSADEKAVHGVLSSATWRYVVLRPGQTVFFNTRTVHFVFRPKGPQTMAFGGHVLLWNNLLEWLRTVVWQLDNENVHNEDMSNCRSYVDAAAAMVRRKVRDKDTALMANGSMSGSQVASRFLKLKKKFDTTMADHEERQRQAAKALQQAKKANAKQLNESKRAKARPLKERKQASQDQQSQPRKRN
ncbi:hypothetical protein NKR19_g9284 [Coniochaeta hoffmannii]|uniref:JmjC domain-containing protein n=1 Tax=Coniochaeta hoffmannii TaxID=91930 RepID=A0AA38VKF2_9PEZI|nr:hypothetical protein NKR19_g9284 [Coniochaeta hoffmannii]